MGAPPSRILGAIYDLVRGHEKTAFALLRGTGDGIVALAGPALKKFLRDVDQKAPIPDNRAHNEVVETEELADLLQGGMIENQNAAVCSRMKVGTADLAFAGCGIIAVYNLLVSFGESPSLAALIARFEKNILMLKGQFGSDPFKIAELLEDEGFAVTHLDPDYTGPGERFICTFWNDKEDIRDSAHTILLTREPDGLLRSHNNRDGDARFAGIADFFARHPKVRPIMVIRVEK